jgi:rhamnogalacturonan acetylesterase
MVIQFRMRNFLLFAAAFFALTSLSAQPPAPGQVATPDAPTQTNLSRDAALNPALPTVFVVGDSTARNGADLGWADHFAPFFDTSRINVANRAMAGRSSRTFINEGRWTAVLAQLKKGDFVLLQMGHNDGGDLDGAKPRGTLKGIGNETRDLPQTSGPLAGTTETVHTYGWYMRKMIDETKARGATPILLTPTVRNIWKGGQVERDIGYNEYVRQIGAQEGIQVADMATLEAEYLQTLGPEKTALLFPKDHTHTSPEGATLNAEHVAEALRRVHTPLVQYLLPRRNFAQPAS